MKFIKNYKVYEAQIGDFIGDVISKGINLKEISNDDILIIFNDIYIFIDENTTEKSAYEMYMKKIHKKENSDNEK